MAYNAPHSMLHTPHSDDAHHPLHRVYRKRIRGIRMRWFGSGCAVGVVAGILFTLLVSAVVVTQVPEVVQSFTGEPDVAVVIGESYLNREASNRINNSYPTGVPNLTLTNLDINLTPGNRMDMQPVFNADLGFLGNIPINASVKNQLTVQDGKLVLAMIGDPQLGNLNLPLELLPFDLKGRVKQAIDKVNNNVLIAEINQSLESGFGGSAFVVEGVTTNDSGMTIRLQQKP